MTSKMGRPRLEFDAQVFEALVFAQCNRKEIVEYMAISDDTLDRRVQEHYGCTFAEVLDKRKRAGVANARVRLYRQALGEKDNTAALIFFLKNYGGMADVTRDERQPVTLGDLPVPDEPRNLSKPN